MYGYSRNTAPTLGTGVIQKSADRLLNFTYVRDISQLCSRPVYLLCPSLFFLVSDFHLASTLLYSKRLFAPLQDNGDKFSTIIDCISNKFTVNVWKISRMYVVCSFDRMKLQF